jgi:hypothetical protein
LWGVPHSTKLASSSSSSSSSSSALSSSSSSLTTSISHGPSEPSYGRSAGRRQEEDCTKSQFPCPTEYN